MGMSRGDGWIGVYLRVCMWETRGAVPLFWSVAGSNGIRERTTTTFLRLYARQGKKKRLLNEWGEMEMAARRVGAIERPRSAKE